MNDEEKILNARKAAYALNLCTVSVGQIIDYKDVNVLEQEYEAILNNLNLRNMPKEDDSLLSILTHLLDTITFFRIDEEEKKIIDQEYQAKMKNAIWSSLPNLSALISSGASAVSAGAASSISASAASVSAGGATVAAANAGAATAGTGAATAGAAAGTGALSGAAGWIGLAVTAASILMMVGTGYMNYRRTKAQISLEHDAEKFRLYKTELDQFNSLQRELFTTAWKMSDSFGFDDELRLTENQIKRYNKILMDTNPVRKYERLNAIKNEFKGYPPFSYFFGNAAYSLALNYSISISNEKRHELITVAKCSYKEMLDRKDYDILRNDPIIATCALEYADLLNPIEDKKEIITNIERAIKMCGHSYDILELCALSYLKIGEVERAMKIFKELYNDGYNKTVNAQLLSMYYVSHGLLDDRVMLEGTGVNRKYLFPNPQDTENDGKDIEDLKSLFIDNQIELLMNNYGYTIYNYYEHKSWEFCNLPYMNDDNAFKKELLKFLSGFVNDLGSLLDEEDRDDRRNLYMLIITNWLKKNYDNTFAGDSWRKSTSTSKLYKFDQMMLSFMTEFVTDIQTMCLKIKDNYVDDDNILQSRLMQITQADKNIQDFTKKTGIVDSHEEHDIEEDVNDGINSQFKVLLNGKDNTEMKGKAIAKVNAFRNLISSNGDKVLLEKDGEQFFSDIFAKLQKFNSSKNDSFAIVLPDKDKGPLLIFTLYGIIFDGSVRKQMMSYKSVFKGRKNDSLNIGSIVYKNKDIDLGYLYTLCAELSGILENVSARKAWMEVLLPAEGQNSADDFFKLVVDECVVELGKGTIITGIVTSGFIVKGETVKIKSSNRVKSTKVIAITKNNEDVVSAFVNEKVSIIVEDMIQHIVPGDFMINMDSAVEG